MTSFHTLAMKGGPLAKGLEVYLDGMPLKGLISVSISANVDDVVRVTMEMITKLEATEFKTVDPELIIPADLPPHMQKIAEDLVALAKKES